VDENAKAMYRDMLVEQWNTLNTFISKVEAKVGDNKDIDKAWKTVDTLMASLMKACGIKKDEIAMEETEVEEETAVSDEETE
jgi:hypothetical protein